MGIQDKNLLCIISAMLKAEIEGIGIPSKGVPQGGLCSPLFSNVVLNELDWWISDQWESYETSYPYKRNEGKIRAIRRGSKLKECYIIRYCDDFKIKAVVKGRKRVANSNIKPSAVVKIIAKGKDLIKKIKIQQTRM